MKNIKKSIIIFGAIAIALLMVSSATAVSRVNSEPVMNKVEQLEQLNLDGEELLITFSSIDIDEFLSLYTSIEFAEYLHEDENQDYLYSDEYLDFYNGDDLQNFINTGLFQLFLASDICQTFLNNYFNIDESSPSVFNSQEAVINFQQLEVLMAGAATSTPVDNVGNEINEYEVNSISITSTEVDDENVPEPTFIIIFSLIIIIYLYIAVSIVVEAFFMAFLGMLIDAIFGWWL